MGSSNKRPNFLIITASDLGFTDIGPYGSEIETPTLDRLSREGITMTGFHTPSASSPTRAMLLSGTDQHIAGLGQLADYMRVHKPYQGKLGYESYLNSSVATLPEILRDHGYYTCMSGKWHLGVKKDQGPHARGFDRSFAYLAGTGNHFNEEPQLGDLVDYLYRHPAVDSEGLWMRDGQFVDRRRDLPRDFYSSSTFVDALLDQLEHRPNPAHQPFFAYLPLTAPHWPLQAPAETIAKYASLYDDGPDRLRARRLQSLAEHGLYPRGVGTTPSPSTPPSASSLPSPPPTTTSTTTTKPSTPTKPHPSEPPFSSLSPSQRAHSSRTMAVYAAMIDQLDQHLDRVMSYLASRGELDNTFILFHSDNAGGQGQILEALPLLPGNGAALPHLVGRFCNNSTKNLGSGSSFVWKGSQWCWAGAAPGSVGGAGMEGCTRGPAIVRFPGFFGSGGGNGERTRDGRRVSHEFASVMDVLPTVLELAGATHPGGRYRGREVALPRGRSWVGHFLGREDKIHAHHAAAVIGMWRVFGRRSVRRGKWKAVFIPAPWGQDAWELYDMARDPKEMRNLAGKEPEVLEQLLLEWETCYAETGMYDPGVEENRVPSSPEQQRFPRMVLK